jgi:hypothetical protein
MIPFWCFDVAVKSTFTAHVESNGTQNAVSRAVSGNHARNYKNIIFVAAEEGVPGYNLIAKLKHDDWDISRLVCLDFVQTYISIALTCGTSDQPERLDEFMGRSEVFNQHCPNY